MTRGRRKKVIVGDERAGDGRRGCGRESIQAAGITGTESPTGSLLWALLDPGSVVLAQVEGESLVQGHAAACCCQSLRRYLGNCLQASTRASFAWFSTSCSLQKRSPSSESCQWGEKSSMLSLLPLGDAVMARDHRMNGVEVFVLREQYWGGSVKKDGRGRRRYKPCLYSTYTHFRTRTMEMAFL
jgi:hypothetical protein